MIEFRRITHVVFYLQLRILYFGLCQLSTFRFNATFSLFPVPCSFEHHTSSKNSSRFIRSFMQKLVLTFPTCGVNIWCFWLCVGPSGGAGIIAVAKLAAGFRLPRWICWWNRSCCFQFILFFFPMFKSAAKKHELANSLFFEEIYMGLSLVDLNRHVPLQLCTGICFNLFSLKERYADPQVTATEYVHMQSSTIPWWSASQRDWLTPIAIPLLPHSSIYQQILFKVQDDVKCICKYNAGALIFIKVFCLQLETTCMPFVEPLRPCRL